MKDISKIIGLGTSVVTIVLIFTLIGKLTNRFALFIILGFVIAISYLMKEIIKK